jgi:hypothetical protein
MIYIYGDMYIYICVDIFIYIYIYVCVDIYIYVDIYICRYIYICMHRYVIDRVSTMSLGLWVSPKMITYGQQRDD